MSEIDLSVAWRILETESLKDRSGIEVVPSGVEVSAGSVLVGVDNTGLRYLLIPLLPGEAFAEDRSGRSIQLWRIDEKAKFYLAAVCLATDLNVVFTQFVQELLAEVTSAASPARAVIDGLARWRRLFADVRTEHLLSQQKLIGLLGELLVLEQILARDPARQVGIWKGPTGAPHDFRQGERSLEVKTTLTREGRIVPISSIDQLTTPSNGSLYLAHLQLEADAKGDSLPAVVDRVLAAGVEQSKFLTLLNSVGYRLENAPDYLPFCFSLTARRVYDVNSEWFPKLTSTSFALGDTPPGVLHISYSIDLTNEPPTPLTHDQEIEMIEQLVH